MPTAYGALMPRRSNANWRPSAATASRSSIADACSRPSRRSNSRSSDLGSHDALAKLSEEAGGVPTIVLGTLRGCAGRELTVQCKLLSTENAEVLGSSDGVALLNESEWAMRGRSVVVRPEDHRPTASGPSPLR